MIRVFLVDDHTVLRHGMRLLLTDRPGLSVVGEASNGQELFEQLPTTPADVVLLDVNLPGMDAPTITRQLVAQYPAVQVLVLSMEAGIEHIFRLLDAGAQGYVLKSAGLEEIIHGIRMVADGRTFLSCDIGLAALHQLRGQLHHDASPLAAAGPETPAKLSRRETEVLQLIAEGLTNQEIADKLFTSKRTIETHRQNIIGKTQMKNTASLIRFAVSEGLVD